MYSTLLLLIIRMVFRDYLPLTSINKVLIGRIKISLDVYMLNFEQSIRLS